MIRSSKPRSVATQRKSGLRFRSDFERIKDNQEKVPGRGTKQLTAIEKARIARS